MRAEQDRLRLGIAAGDADQHRGCLAARQHRDIRRRNPAGPQRPGKIVGHERHLLVPLAVRKPMIRS
jgi:hypothetical protein